MQPAELYPRAKLRLACLLVVTGIITLGAVTAKTRYSQFSNKELRENALHLVKRIREVVYSYDKKDRELLTEYDRRQQVELNRRSAQALRKQWLQESDTLHDSTMRKYKELYWSDAILLRDEILRRLPKQKQQSDVLNLYQHPTNVLGVKAVADHLELIAKSLPD